MTDWTSALTGDERIIFTLRSLYARYGYAPYRMSKFEEYDLYGKNKEFLVSDSVIAFTDVGGKLMALKPDVTLSIVKNTRDGDGHKLYYNENVYRVPKGGHAFREIMQVGLECIGALTQCDICEVLWLAANSLNAILEDFVLDVSHLGLTAAALDSLSVTDDVRAALLKCVGEKNTHEISALCSENHVEEEKKNALLELISVSSPAAEAIAELEALTEVFGARDAVDELKRTLRVFDGSGFENRIHVDASVISDMNYYNGIVFKGFVRGAPGSVLTGGQYDRLMKKMKRSSKAIGFAVYLDMLERLYDDAQPFDADLMLICPPDTDPAVLRRTLDRLIGEGKTVRTAEKIDPEFRAKSVAKLENGEVIPLE